MTENELATIVIGAAIHVHNELGPGLLESSYKAALFYKLSKLNLKAIREKPIPLIFEGEKLEIGYRLDLLVNEKLVVEIKSVDALNDLHIAQVLTYLRLGDFKLGLLINFNVLLLKDGIKRVVNGL